MAAANDVKFSLKVTINKAKTKVLFVEANGDFVDVLLSFLTIPLGKFVKILNNHFGDEAPFLGSLNTLYNGLDNLEGVHFWTEGARQLLLNPRSSFDAERCIIKHMKLPHGSISEKQILPLTEETLSGHEKIVKSISSFKFPNGQGSYVKGPRSYILTDDLTVTPFSMSWTISMLNSVSDIKEVELQIGVLEALNILQTALSSTCVLSAFINSISKKRPRQDDA